MTEREAKIFVNEWLEFNSGDIDDFIEPILEKAKENGVPKSTIDLVDKLFTAMGTQFVMPLVITALQEQGRKN